MSRWCIFEKIAKITVTGLKCLFKKLVDKYHRKIHGKNYDDWFINGGDILLFELCLEEIRIIIKEEKQVIEVSKSSIKKTN